jgi:hypothetical protein
MKIKRSEPAVQRWWRHSVVLFMFMSFSSLVLIQGATQLTSLRKVMALQLGETAEGSRVTIVADGALDDYEAFRRGDRFYVRIPSAVFSSTTPTFTGNGFEDVQIQKVGDSLVISFKLQPGASARVNEFSNRLDVLFVAPTRIASTNVANVVRNRVTSTSSSSQQQSGRPSRRHIDAAGPVPPGSPVEATPGNSAALETARARETSPGLRRNQAPKANESATADAKPQLEQQAPGAGIPPSAPASSPYSSTYTPTVATQPTSSEAYRSTQNGSNAPSGLSARKAVVMQWVSMNRTVTAIGAGVLFSLVLLLGLIFYRRRMKSRTRQANAVRAKPKYSPDIDLEDVLAEESGSPSEKVGPTGYVDEFAYDMWGGDEVLDTTSQVETDASVTERASWLEVMDNQEEVINTYDRQWKSTNQPIRPEIPVDRMGSDREVFEL